MMIKKKKQPVPRVFLCKEKTRGNTQNFRGFEAHSKNNRLESL